MLFADDTTLYKSSTNINELYTNMNADLKVLSDWFQANKLSLNVNKSNYMLFTKRRADVSNRCLKIGSVEIKRKRCIKFLGLHLDENLNWKDHIEICKSKISSSIYAINRVKHIIPKKYLRTLYFTMIYPYLTYCIPIWGSTYNVHKNKLVTIQKRIVRIISGAKYNDHTNMLFCQLHILKLDDIYRLQVAKLVFKHKLNMLPLPLRSLFVSNSDRQTIRTRQFNDLYVKKCRTTLATQHVSSKGPQIWNSLPAGMKELTTGTIKKFTSQLINHIVHEYSEAN
jgi:hypothetical protein